MIRYTDTYAGINKKIKSIDPNIMDEIYNLMTKTKNMSNINPQPLHNMSDKVETDDTLTYFYVATGLDKKDIDIHTKDQQIIISSNANVSFNLQSIIRSSISIDREIWDIDSIDASLKKGILKITLKKKTEEQLNKEKTIIKIK